jgi:hypothetical protein
VDGGPPPAAGGSLARAGAGGRATACAITSSPWGLRTRHRGGTAAGMRGWARPRPSTRSTATGGWPPAARSYASCRTCSPPDAAPQPRATSRWPSPRRSRRGTSCG